MTTLKYTDLEAQWFDWFHIDVGLRSDSNHSLLSDTVPGSGGHTGGASGAVHQGPRPLGAHQRGPDSNFFEKLISSVSHVTSHSGYYREIVF